ncbi:MAG: 2-dehydropantoate 2-reductase [Pseudomonadota bacterium]
MRILVVGAGGTGGYYGGRLFQAGRDVSFLVRPARAVSLRERGLQIVSPHGDATLHPPLVTADAIGSTFDVVLLSVKAYALDQAIADFAPAVGPNTLIVPVLNGMRHIELLAERFGAQAVLGGVSHIATTVDDAGRIVQLAPFQKLTYGARRSAGAADVGRLAALHALMSDAGFEARLSDEIERDLWEKWVFLATLGGITCLMRGTIGEIEAAPGGAALARQLLGECAAVATASGQAPTVAFMAQTEATVTAAGSGLASSMYRDLQRGLNVEVDQILGDLLVRAHGVSVATPLLATAFAHLRVYAGKLRRS